jgi:4-cresol dehydrogenase (hydroxylating) flavoprotein subunit
MLTRTVTEIKEDRFARALEAWRQAIGAEYVITDQEALAQAETATFETTQRVPAILQPANLADVQACVRIANTYKVPIYPVSNGKNWGYGSQVPAQDGCVILHLQRMQHITEYNERLAYVTVEPGVTVRQLYHYLHERNSPLFVSVVGGPMDTSLIGNTLERGLGTGRYSDRFGYVCDFEVVLPTGECVHTGYERFPNAQAGQVSRWSVGPYFDGLFTQSNFGIVTSMTIWLLPTPRAATVCLFTLKDDARLEKLIDALYVLRFEGGSPSIYLYNDYKFLSMLIGQRPDVVIPDGTFLSPEIMRSIRSALGFASWSGSIELQCASKQLCEAMCAFIRETLSNKVDTLRFFSVNDQSIEQVVGETDGRGVVDLLSVGRSLNTVSNDGGLRTTYWRKKTPPPATDMNPDRDRCGVIWCAPLIPLTGEHVRAAKTIIEQVTFAHTMEPHLSLECVTERTVIITVVLLYDRDVAGEDARAMACHDELLQKLTEAGYIPYRLGIHSMQGLPAPVDDSVLLHQRIKNSLDPNAILAPGRYDFCS